MSIKSKIGLGLIALIQLVLIILKACNVITWNWVLVFMPAILSISLMVLFVIFCVFVVIASIRMDE
jgi:hypothetical protein